METKVSVITTKILRLCGKVLFEAAVDTVKAALLLAISSGANLRYANLSGADLSGANLSGANLRYANLSGADLSGADLRYANLSGANLSDANLSGANLSDANLSGANLSDANLRYANLSGADLSGADLRYANLSGADLGYANLSGADLPSPTIVLLARWTVSDILCRDLMAYDAACHPDPMAFTAWARGGPCPYNDVKVQRAANFKEKRELWDANAVLSRPYDLMIRVLTENCPVWTDEQTAAFQAKFIKLTQTSED
jgi:hypothetical protein